MNARVAAQAAKGLPKFLAKGHEGGSPADVAHFFLNHFYASKFDGRLSSGGGRVGSGRSDMPRAIVAHHRSYSQPAHVGYGKVIAVRNST
jgi:hypothetical protein